MPNRYLGNRLVPFDLPLTHNLPLCALLARTHEDIMTQTHASRPLAAPLRSRINRLAHSQALHHETRLKASIMEQLLTARDAGASFVEISALLDAMEAAPP